MKNLLTALVLACCASVCWAQACGDTPYTVEAQTKGGAITVVLPPALSSDGKKPASIQAAAEHTRTMYAAMGPSVVREILQNYTCRVNGAIDADATKTPEQKAVIKEAWQNAVNDVVTTSAIYFGAFKVDIAQAQLLNPVSLIQPLDSDARVPSAYLNAIPSENFTLQNSLSAWVSATYKGVTATACGTYLKAALAANAANIQHLAGAVRPVMNAYFDVNTKAGPRNAKVILYGEAPSVLLATPPTDAAAQTSLKQCAAQP